MVLGVWGEAHPQPHTPLIQLADGSELTPAEIGQAASAMEGRYGRLIYRLFAAAMIDDKVEPFESLAEILADFERDTALWLGESRLD